MEHPGDNFHVNFGIATEKARPSSEGRAFVSLLKA
jgi:hypothetical protein